MPKLDDHEVEEFLAETELKAGKPKRGRPPKNTPPLPAADPAEVAAALGVGLPTGDPKPHEDVVYAHGPLPPEYDYSGVEAVKRDPNMHFRWVAHDDRDRYSHALELGYRPVKGKEAQVHGFLKGHVGADGFQRWQRDLVLMVAGKDQVAERKAKLVAENKARLKRAKEGLREQLRREGAAGNTVFGDVRTGE